MSEQTRTPIPEYAHDYPETAQTLEQVRLPFYCCNCLRKKETAYVTPNFGPFCDDCMHELREAAAYSSAPHHESCESECNPYSATCGAKFCTYGAMAAHERTHTAETVPPAPATPALTVQPEYTLRGHGTIVVGDDRALASAVRAAIRLSPVSRVTVQTVESALRQREAAALPVREDAPPPGGVRSVEKDTKDMLTRRDTSDD